MCVFFHIAFVLVVYLSKLAHLPQVIVSLLQPCELPQEALVLPPLLVKLRPQSRCGLRRRLLRESCTGDKKIEKMEENGDGKAKGKSGTFLCLFLLKQACRETLRFCAE